MRLDKLNTLSMQFVSSSSLKSTSPTTSMSSFSMTADVFLALAASSSSEDESSDDESSLELSAEEELLDENLGLGASASGVGAVIWIGTLGWDLADC